PPADASSIAGRLPPRPRAAGSRPERTIRGISHLAMNFIPKEGLAMRKRLGVVALVLAFAVFATAAAQARPHAGVTINFMTYVWQPTTVAATKQIVQQWNATHPNIQVNEIQIDPNSVHDTMCTNFVGGTSPDIL